MATYAQSKAIAECLMPQDSDAFHEAQSLRVQAVLDRLDGAEKDQAAADLRNRKAEQSRVFADLRHTLGRVDSLLRSTAQPSPVDRRNRQGGYQSKEVYPWQA